MTAAFRLSDFPPVLGWLMPPNSASREANERIGMALRQARKKAWGVYGSLARTAELAGVSQGTLSAIERGDHPISKVRPENLQRFPEAYGMTAAEFAQLTGVTLVIPAEGQPQPEHVRIVDNLHRVPVRTMAAAGEAFYSDASIIDYEYVPGDLYRPGMLVVKVMGDSMTPTITPGDYVYVDIRLTDKQHGKVFLVNIVGNGFVLKRAKQINDELWVLDSDNSNYPPLMPDEAQIVGQAYYRQRGDNL